MCQAFGRAKDPIVNKADVVPAQGGLSMTRGKQTATQNRDILRVADLQPSFSAKVTLRMSSRKKELCLQKPYEVGKRVSL